MKYIKIKSGLSGLKVLLFKQPKLNNYLTIEDIEVKTNRDGSVTVRIYLDNKNEDVKFRDQAAIQKHISDLLEKAGFNKPSGFNDISGYNFNPVLTFDINK